MKMNRLGNWLPRASAWTTTSLMLGLAMAACITRPVGTQPPTTKVNFTSTQAQQAVDKVDLLFAIDNSSSMGDKQQILADAVPTLLNGLLYPACVDPDTGAAAPVTDASNPLSGRANPVGTKAGHYGCPVVGTKQYEAEFTPVTDLHIGIVSSSLGTLGGGLNTGPGGVSGDLCPVSDPTHNYNDNAHLLARPLVADSANPNSKTDANGSVAVTSAAPPANFLSWFPESEANANTARHPKPAVAIDNSTVLANNFQSLVFGTNQKGCGLEAQLESMYRFLIQPDPYLQIGKDNEGKADLGEGVDWDLLAQRAQFLRPDSLVAVIMLTDEDDSSADPLSIGGLGFNYESAFFQGSSVARGSDAANGTTAPLPTTICATDPANANCSTCGFAAKCNDNSAFCQSLKSDPNCAKAAPYYASDDDAMNVRFFHMKQRYGVDPQYPVSRYVNGFSNARVPDRTTEHTITKSAAGSRTISNYVGAPKCTNPLFAASLPTAQGQEACKLPVGTRDVSKIFFAVIGGVPNQLLYGAKADGTADYRPGEPEHNTVTPERWKTILGADPARFDYTGIDPHMIQSIEPRPELAAGGAASSPRGNNGADIVSGREWDTKKTDLQFACVFDLAQPKQCEGPPNKLGQPTDVESCDCNPTPSNQPLCQSATTNVQVRAKAYPTIRELQVVHALGDQGIAASLCPVDIATTNAANPNKLSPTYGYNPAVASIIDRLKNALTQTCLPQSLRDVPDGGFAAGADLTVPCLILAQLSPDANQSCADNGLKDTDADVLKVFHEQQVAESTDSKDPRSLANRKVCTVPQLPEAPGATCKTETQKAWCYVENAGDAKAAGRCSQAIVFSAGTADLVDARFSLQCIRQFSPGAAAGDTANSSSSQ